MKALKTTSSEKDIWPELARLPERAGIRDLRIAVAAGGIGPERDVSLQSGAAVYEVGGGSYRFISKGWRP